MKENTLNMTNSHSLYHKPWRKKRLERLKELYNNGYTLQQILNEFEGCKESGVIYQLKTYLGIEHPFEQTSAVQPKLVQPTQPPKPTIRSAPDVAPFTFPNFGKVTTENEEQTPLATAVYQLKAELSKNILSYEKVLKELQKLLNAELKRQPKDATACQIIREAINDCSKYADDAFLAGWLQRQQDPTSLEPEEQQEKQIWDYSDGEHNHTRCYDKLEDQVNLNLIIHGDSNDWIY